MKLILITAFLIHTGRVKGNDQYSFSPQFNNQNSGVFASDSSIYLPPEPHTPVPYFPLKKMNNLPFPYLPPTGTKAPPMYPSPFPVILSSTLIPIFDDDEKEHEERNKIRISSPIPPPRQEPKANHSSSENNPNVQQAMRREMRFPPKMPNYYNPVDRIDMKLPARDFPPGFTTANPINQSPRNMIISADTHRNDRGIDQIRAHSGINPLYLPPVGFGISSTTEPAIPILRLSNEMDLDGSFSYEALGADQTHYVQHSHMENVGSEKEEQVVEGSYSYVGDNGQTYTVHYIADSNGFRASGEHLPVAPPIPEIIQRSVQYNLAEEAKKPPHLRAWQVDEKEHEQHYQNLPPAPPLRSLFTGRVPEAFSFNFGQGSNNDHNNIVAAPSSQVPVNSNGGIIIDQTKGKSNGPISPQVTFLASQGAHVPSMNSPQQSITRSFTPEKPAMSQLTNYNGAGNKEAEQEANKNLWRWQNELNSNNGNQTPDKNTISRSSGEGDDIMINFSDMTPDQYTRMIHSQLEATTAAPYFPNNNQQNNNKNQIQFDGVKMMSDYQNNNINNYYTTNNDNNQFYASTPATTYPSYSTSFPNNIYKQESTVLPYTLSSIITPTQSNYLNPAETQSFDYPENAYESKRIKSFHGDLTTKSTVTKMNAISDYDREQKGSYNHIWSNAKDLQLRLQNEPKIMPQAPQQFSTVSIPYSESHEQNTEFKPILIPKKEEHITTTTSTTTTMMPESTTEDLFKTNIFLKSLSFQKKNEQKHSNKIVEEPKKNTPNKILAETKADKISKFVPYQPKAHNEPKPLKKKSPMELSDLINYINMKNYFESSKVKPNNSYGNSNYDNRKEMRYNPVQYDSNESEDEEEYELPKPKSHLQSTHSQEQEELRGIIKNYKVLQRNNHARHSEMHPFPNRIEKLPNSVKTLQSSGLPPLGRAGPSMKTYLPPIYV